MIKVNLLDSFYSASPEALMITEESKSTQKNFLKHILVMVLGIGALFGYENYNVPILQQQLSAIQNEINEASSFNQKMDGLKKEIEKYEQDLKRLNSQTEFLQKVQKERTLSVELINKMKDIITPKVWLISIEVNDNSIDISGEAESIGDVNEFNNKLAATNYLKDVITTSIESKNSEIIKIPIQIFHMKASYVDGRQLIESTSTPNEISKESSMPTTEEVKK